MRSATPEVMAAVRNSRGFIGENHASLAAINPKIAPVPMCTRAAHPMARHPHLFIHTLLPERIIPIYAILITK
jgi:hypothetical protein